MRALTELALDGNAVALDPKYRMSVIEALPSLRHLDLKRVSEEERRQAMRIDDARVLHVT